MVSKLTSIQPEETKIFGQWITEHGQLVANASAKRIDYLVENELQELGRTQDGWSVLYVDTADGRFWQLSYPDSGEHGGGAPCLEVLTRDAARDRFGSDPLPPVR